MFKIGLLGGPNTGKSSLLRRFCGKPFQSQYIPTKDSYQVGTFCCGEEIVVNVIDFDGSYVMKYFGSSGYAGGGRYSGRRGSARDESGAANGNNSGNNSPSILSPYSPAISTICSVENSNVLSELCALDAVILVIDVSERESFRHLDNWLELLDSIPSASNQSGEEIDKYLFAHKADKPDWVISPQNLSVFCSRNGIVDYAATVSHPRLGDMDYSRPAYAKQRAPEDILREIVFKLWHKKCAILTATSYPKYEHHSDAELFGAPVLKFVEFSMESLSHDENDDAAEHNFGLNTPGTVS
jgi:hypothetical protein